MDEVQNISGWEHFARRKADQKERVYFTGSNSKMLRIEMEAKPGGRYLSKEIMPYDFREYLLARDIPYDEESLHTAKGTARLRKAAQDYLHDRGFPGSLSFISKREYVENVYQKIILGILPCKTISGRRWD